MLTIRNKERCDDVGPQDAAGFFEYAYRDYNYDLVAGKRVFRVRTYDDEPGLATIINPTDARSCPEARQLVAFIVSTLACTKVKFYSGSHGTYRPIDMRTLDFEPDVA